MSEVFHEGDMLDALVEYDMAHMAFSELLDKAEKQLRTDYEAMGTDKIRERYYDLMGI
jgi:hypothetical protein